MATIGIMGESGHGKTTAMRTLDPKTTFIIDADQKGLSWKGWKTQYNGKNYVKTSNAGKIRKLMQNVSEKPEFAHITVLVIDTLNAVMVDDEMARMKEKNFDKWIDLATSVYGICKYANEVRDNLTVVLMFHTEFISDENTNEYYTRVLTSGKKLQKIKLESKLPILLFAKCKTDKRGHREYVFETQSEHSTAKSPMDMFTDFEIPNDLQYILKKIREYEDFPSDEKPEKQIPVPETNLNIPINNHTSQEYQDLDKDVGYLIWLMKRSDEADIDNAQYQVEIQWYEKQEHTLDGLKQALPKLTAKVEATDFTAPIPTPEEMNTWAKEMEKSFHTHPSILVEFATVRGEKQWDEVCRLYFDAKWEYEHQEEQK